MKEISVSAVVPAYNESGAVADVVKELSLVLSGQVAKFEVIVVDDGSTDETADLARKAGAVVVSHPVNRGYGRALVTGIDAAQYDWVLMIDADGSYSPDDIASLLEPLPAFDLVIGARSGKNFWGSPRQALMRWIYLQIAAFVVGEPIPDANSGLRIVRRSVTLLPAPVKCFGYSYSTTMTLSFMRLGRFVKFVPIQYLSRTGRSKVRLGRDVMRTLQLMTEVMIAYNPLKLFATITLILAAFGAFLFFFASLEAALICGLAALVAFSTGCILDSLRMNIRGS